MVVMQNQALGCCGSQAHWTLGTQLVWLSHAPCGPEQQRWNTYVSVLPFDWATFGLLQGRFDLHPAMHEMNAGGESQKLLSKDF